MQVVSDIQVWVIYSGKGHNPPGGSVPFLYVFYVVCYTKSSQQ